MRLVRWWCAGVVVGLLLATAPSCGLIPSEDCESDCDGCCDADGECQSGIAGNACGSGGLACTTCGLTQACVGGVCVSLTGGSDGGPKPDGGGDAGSDGGTDGGGTCDSSNCTGCCSGTECFTGGGNGACGLNGVQCDTCTGNEVCNAAGQCAPCGPGNCAGCCTSNGCQAGNSSTQCGNGGAACQVCSPPTCTALPDGGGGACGTPAAVGSPCSTNAQCSGLGAGAICKLETAGGAPYVGGYCTRRCTTAAGSSAECGGAPCSSAPTGGEPDLICLSQCVTHSDCREPDYSCYGVGGVGACWIDPFPTPGEIGSACTSDNTCQQGGLEPNGLCFLESEGGGWLRGYCTEDCLADPTNACGPNAVCMDFSGGAGTIGLCLDHCRSPNAGQSNCRPNYVCLQYTVGGIPAAEGVCVPNCNNAGAACGAGETCNSQGYCQ